jgi:hypothetical protein
MDLREMKKYLVLCLTLTLIACGPSAENATRVAAVTCAVMGETRNMDAAIRVREMNAAREKIGGEPFLRGDDAIKESFDYGLCEELVLDDSYDASLRHLKKRLAEKRAEEERIAAEKERIAAEKRAEEERIAAEKRKNLLPTFFTADSIDFFGVKLDYNFKIIELAERQQNRNIEIGDELLEIRTEPVDVDLLSKYLTRDFSNDPPALSITIGRKGQRKTRSIRIP